MDHKKGVQEGTLQEMSETKKMEEFLFQEKKHNEKNLKISLQIDILEILKGIRQEYGKLKSGLNIRLT